MVGIVQQIPLYHYMLGMYGRDGMGIVQQILLYHYMLGMYGRDCPTDPVVPLYARDVW